MNKKEKKHLENIAYDSWYAKGANYASILYSEKIFERHLNEGSVLELGPAEGVMTKNLMTKFSDYTVVEGSSFFCNKLKAQNPKLKVFNSLFEDFNPKKKYDNILLGHVLEHVLYPVQILLKVKNWLSINGKILAAVPNANSIHRQAAVMMGILKTKYDLNESDIHHGHRRVYDLASFKNDFIKAELKIVTIGGYWIKPVSNKQIEKTWTENMLNAFMKLGEQYPDIAAEIYIIATKN